MDFEGKKAGEVFDPVMRMTGQAEADSFLEEYAAYIAGCQGISVPEAKVIARSNIGYYAGYNDLETRQRVELLFGAPHPMLGSSFGPQPTPDDAFRMGQEMARDGGRTHKARMKKAMKEALTDAVVKDVLGDQ